MNLRVFYLTRRGISDGYALNNISWFCWESRQTPCLLTLSHWHYRKKIHFRQPKLLRQRLWLVSAHGTRHDRIWDERRSHLGRETQAPGTRDASTWDNAQVNTGWHLLTSIGNKTNIDFKMEVPSIINKTVINKYIRRIYLKTKGIKKIT